ncbi:MAG: metal-dependent hydrolase [Halobacteriaceae archaeon]
MNQREHVLNAALLGVGLAYVLEPSGGIVTFRTAAAVGVPVVLGALFPDVDAHYGRHRKALHNLAVLGFFIAFPAVFGNLQWVWLGVLTHYVLDIAGSRRGIALFYPVWKREFGLPVGVPVASSHSGIVTVLITVVEVGAAAAVVWYAPPTVVEAATALV